MMPVTHLVASVGAVGWVFGPDPVALVCAVAGATVPDLDELQSPMGYRLSLAVGSLPLGIGRQRTHSLFAMAIMSLGVFILVGSVEWALAFGIGWATHLILDALSGGVPLWWPWKQGPEHRVGIVRVHPAGAIDWILCTVMGCAVVMMILQDQWIPAWAEQLRTAVAASGGK